MKKVLLPRVRIGLCTTYLKSFKVFVSMRRIHIFKYKIDYRTNNILRNTSVSLVNGVVLFVEMIKLWISKMNLPVPDLD